MSAVVAMQRNDWDTVRLGDVLTLHYGKALPASARNPNGAVPVYGANGIKDYADQSLCDGQTLVIGRKGSAGQITRVTGPFWPLDVTYYTEHDPQRLDFDYMAYALSMLDLPLFARGVKPGINRNDVYALEIELPGLEEQQRIVTVLDQAFAALDRARAHAEANLADARELFDNTLSGTFSLPHKGWVEAAIGDCIRFIDYRGRTPEKTVSGLRLITAKNVKKGYLQDEPREFVAEDSYSGWMTRGIPVMGDVLFTTEAPLGNVAQLDTNEKVVFAQRVIIMQPDINRLDRTFLKYLLLSSPVQKRIHANATGATALGIKASLLKTIKITFPEKIAEQHGIVEKLDRLQDEAKRLESHYARKLADLATLRQSLLHQAFAGELT